VHGAAPQLPWGQGYLYSNAHFKTFYIRYTTSALTTHNFLRNILHTECFHGSLSECRAFGDRDLAPHITAEPGLRLVDLPEGRPCVLVLASDGLWDMMGDEHVADELMREIALKTELEVVAQNLIRASERLGSKDDISVILCRVKRGGGSKWRWVKQEEEARGEGGVVEPLMQAGAGASEGILV
jgi:serine/threonine protein phosphatase PrpC